MNNSTIAQWMAGLLFFGLGLGTGLVAQTTADVPQRKEHHRADLSGAPDMEVVVSTSEYQAGDTMDFHVHHGLEAVYVIQGATIQRQDKDPMQLETGSSALNLRDVKHGGFKVIGDTPLKLFTVHIVDQDKPMYDFSK